MIQHVKLANNLITKGGGKIIITDLHVKTIIGVHDWERETERDVYFTIELGVSTQKAGVSDRLDDTVDYDSLSQRIKSFAESSRFNLIEALAESCAEIILKEFNVCDVTLQLEKPAAMQDVRSVAVQIYRFND